MLEALRPAAFGRRTVLRALTAAALAAHARAASAATAQVVIDNFAFAPTPLMIAAGTTVTWLNRDDIPHSIVVAALKVRSHVMDTDEMFSLTFNTAGSYDYICGLHPHMHGQVVVGTERLGPAA